MSRHGYGSGRNWDVQALGSLLGLMIVLTIIMIFLFIKACNLIFRVMAKHPECTALRVQLGMTVVFALGALVSISVQEVASVFASLAMISFLILTANARIVQVYHNQHAIDDVKLTDRVLRRGWWEKDQLQQAQQV